MYLGGLTLNFDKESEFFDSFWFDMADNDEQKGGDELDEIENDETLDLTEVDKMQAFVDGIRALEPGDGVKLWNLLEKLPSGNGDIFQGQVKNRVLKYLNGRNLIETTHKGKSE